MRILTVFVAGVIVGLLVAPDKGENTRRELSKLLAFFSGGDDDNLDEDLITSDDVINRPSGSVG